MVTTVYLIRHCEAEGNAYGLFHGHTDGDITPRGALQLEKLKERCRDIPFTAIYSSPLTRTMKTAQAVNGYHELPIIPEPGIIEINGGLFEGHRWDDLDVMFPKEFDLWKNHFHAFNIDGGESTQSVFQRMKDTIYRVIRENKGGVIGLVSHGCAIRCFLCHARGLNLERIHEIPLSDNTGITRIEFSNTYEPMIIYENDAEHINNDPLTKAPLMWWRK